MLWAGLAGAEYRLDWDFTQGSTAVISFRVYRQANCAGDFVPIVDVLAVDQPSRTYSYVDDAIVPDWEYCWKVTAVDGLGQESPATNVVRFTGIAPVPQPTNLRGAME
jgi:hypothetical protein